MKWSRKVIGANIHVKGNKWNFINLRTWRRKWKMDKYMELKLSDKKHFNWLYVFIKSRTCFRVNPHFIVALNVKELLVRSRREIWGLSDCNWTWTHNHLVHTRTLNHLAKLASLTKWLSVSLWTKWLCPVAITLSCFYRITLLFKKQVFAISLAEIGIDTE